MNRIHFFEIEDQPWCPRTVRNGVTDFIRFLVNTANGFQHIVPRLKAALEKCGTHRIVDLCSGGTGPWLRLERHFAETERFPVQVCLTDKYPNLDSFAYSSRLSGGSITFCSEPVDAADVPDHIRGFRTIFSAFHHFRPGQARALIGDAVRKRCGIAVIDGVHPRSAGVVMAILTQFMVFAVMAFIRPFKWSRILYTYVIPLIPLVILFDGIVSALRVYSPDELMALVEELEPHEYVFDIGCAKISWLPFGPTYLIGYPRVEASGNDMQRSKSASAP